MALGRYRAKRDLSKTPEPTGGKASTKALRFVIQKHAASHLHYDFRLELGGVLKSWAVPKGPSLDPEVKRLAMMVEDHPLDYRQFEGIIPSGNYGAGNVMVWDEGTYAPDPAVKGLAEQQKQLRAALHKGDLKISLHGHKLKGSFALVKIGDDDKSWLLIKHGDKWAKKGVIKGDDTSVLSGRSMAQIAADRPVFKWTNLPKAKAPAKLKPMLATLVDDPFDDPAWLFEVKWDGYRILAHLNGGKVKLMTRNEQDYTDEFAPIAKDLTKLKFNGILDGEVVVVDEHGRSDFGALQNYRRTGQGDLRYYVFDLPYAKGYDLTATSLVQRKQALNGLLKGLKLVAISDDIEAKGKAFFKLAEQHQLEGIVAKRADSLYEVGRRGPNWLKIKTHKRQEAVIAGYTEPRGSRAKLGALVLGVYRGEGLVYIGHIGTGMDETTLTMLSKKLKPLEQKTSPFAEAPKTNAPVHWVSPKLVAEVNFAEWTPDGRMRQPVFVGLREDKSAKKVVAELPKAVAQTVPKFSSKFEPTNLDKVWWPKEGYTKGDVLNYYAEMADVILPYLKGRPESLNRHPGGITADSFYQKNLEDHPSWVKTHKLHSESTDADIRWLVCDDRDTLLYMANLGCIEINPWHSRVGKLDRPDYCLIDIDAKTVGFESVIVVAQACERIFKRLGIASFPKTSGKTGLHLCLPLGAKYSYDQSRQLAELLLRLVNAELPKLTSMERDPDKRKGKIYLDYLQNRHGQTMAAPYSIRPVPGATVSTPLKWSEVRAGLDPTKFTIKTIGSRLKKAGDLWQGVLGRPIDLSDILKRLGS